MVSLKKLLPSKSKSKSKRKSKVQNNHINQNETQIIAVTNEFEQQSLKKDSNNEYNSNSLKASQENDILVHYSEDQDSAGSSFVEKIKASIERTKNFIVITPTTRCQESKEENRDDDNDGKNNKLCNYFYENHDCNKHHNDLYQTLRDCHRPELCSSMAEEEKEEETEEDRLEKKRELIAQRRQKVIRTHKEKWDSFQNQEYFINQSLNSSIVFENENPLSSNEFTFTDHEKIPKIDNDNEIIVKISACSIMTKSTAKKSVIMGTIMNYGEEVLHENCLSIGDRVIAFSPNEEKHSNYVVLKNSGAIFQIQTPSVDDIDALCCLQTYLTAYQCLYRVGNTNNASLDILDINGKSILIVNAACSIISHALIQLAYRGNVKTIYGTCDIKKHGMFLKEMGVTPIDFSQGLLLLQHQVDIVIDGYGKSFEESYQTLNTKDESVRMICLGHDYEFEQKHQEELERIYGSEEEYYSLQEKKNPIFCFVRNNDKEINKSKKSYLCDTFKTKYLMKHCFWYNLHESFQKNPSVFKHDLKYLLTLMSKKKIKPIVADVIPLKLIPLAHERLKLNLAIGIIVCCPFISLLENSHEEDVEKDKLAEEKEEKKNDHELRITKYKRDK